MSFTLSKPFYPQFSPELIYDLSALDELSFVKALDEHIEKTLEKWGAHFRDFKDVVIIGTGGSSLGGQTLLPLQKEDTPTMHFIDNVDAHTFSKLFKKLNAQTTGLIVISKSGETLETISGACLFLDFLEDHLQSNVLCISDPKESTLRKIAEKHDLPVLDHPAYLGGRFSVLSVVGLLPAAIMGLDVHMLKIGARQTLEKTKENLTAPNGPLMAAAQHLEAYKQGHCETVVMPYSDDLRTLALWHAQLWGESLGKENFGLTPLLALGAVDQHSQLQLYLGGPQNKTFTFFTVDLVPDVTFNDDFVPESFAYLKNKKLHNVMLAEAMATQNVIADHNLPNRTFFLKELDEHTFGGLFMHFMLETHFTAHLKGLNAYDQPAVEAGKIKARAILEKS